MRRAVAAAAIAQDQQLVSVGIVGQALFAVPQCDALAGELASVAAGVRVQRRFVLGEIVDAVRDHFAFAAAGKVVVVDNRRLDRIRHAVAIKTAEHLFLFRTDTDHRLAGVAVLLLEPRDVFKRRVAVGVLSHPAFLLRLAATIAVLVKPPRDQVFAGRRAKLLQLAGDLPAREIRPLDAFTHWMARRGVTQHGEKVLDQLRARLSRGLDEAEKAPQGPGKVLDQLRARLG